MALAVARMYLVNNAIATECVVAAELHWLVQNISTEFACEMPKAQWRWRLGKMDCLQSHIFATETCDLLHCDAHIMYKSTGCRLGSVCGGLPRCFPFFGRPPFAFVSFSWQVKQLSSTCGDHCLGDSVLK